MTGREKTCLQDCGHSVSRDEKEVVNLKSVNAEKKSNHWEEQEAEWG